MAKLPVVERVGDTLPRDMTALSPMMLQYHRIKEQHRDALLFYRMGDFYELFFDDAVAAAEALDIALTKRGKAEDRDIPMCGVPVRSADSYLQRLIRQGFKVAICEQTEDPAEARKRGSKSLVAREVVRIMTPGTLTEDSLLDARRHNYLAAVTSIRDRWAIAWSDISSGDFHCMPCPAASLSHQIARIAPGELIIPEGAEDRTGDLIEEFNIPTTPLAPIHFDSTAGERHLLDLFKVRSLEAFGDFSRPELAVMGAVVSYLELTQKGNLPLLRPPSRQRAGLSMQIDAATRRNLEITRDLSGDRSMSLVGTIDRTRTAAGARLLEVRISAPSTDAELIGRQLDAVEWFVNNSEPRRAIRDELGRIPDINRSLSRISSSRGGPRDLSAIRTGLSSARLVRSIFGDGQLPAVLDEQLPLLDLLPEIEALLEEAVVSEPPVQLRDGGFVESGYDTELDEVRQLHKDGRSVIAAMQSEYVEETGIASLKVKFNNVLGYFIETPASHAERMLAEPLSSTFFHRQTTANAIRFTTTRLAETESRILNADDSIAQIERRIFSELCDRIMDAATELAQVAATLAEIDLAAALAELAAECDWTRPVVDDSGVLDIAAGRHPVVENALRNSGAQQFVANGCSLSVSGATPCIRIITGPNMAGKSTYLRQNALIVLLAQSGSFVPADSAHIGLVSQLFSRVGAADELARGRSTFMVEMVETAAILNQADQKALVILDEIGRGTATYDGLSIAWATLEQLHEVNRCRTLFATHYHELTHMAQRLDRVALSTVAVREWEGEVVFLHELRDGAADRSYGIQVAKLAGMPPSVVTRAQEVLDRLEQGQDSQKSRAESMLAGLPLFADLLEASGSPVAHAPSAAEEHLRKIRPDELSPREALDLVYELKDMLNDG